MRCSVAVHSIGTSISDYFTGHLYLIYSLFDTSIWIHFLCRCHDSSFAKNLERQASSSPDGELMDILILGHSSEVNRNEVWLRISMWNVQRIYHLPVSRLKNSV